MDSAIAAAVHALQAGRVVVYPTETVYGLGADATSSAALALLARIKGRGETKGVAVLVANLSSAAVLVAGTIPKAAVLLADAFWPGPLTIVLPAAQTVESWLVGPGGGVGLRCSPDPYASSLVAAFGRPVTATSANPAGLSPAEDAEAARNYFGDRVDAYVDGGSRAGVSVSSVVEFFRGRAILRREGAIEVSTLSSITPIEPLE